MCDIDNDANRSQTCLGGGARKLRSLTLTPTMSSGNMSPASTALDEPVRNARISLLHPLVWVLQMLYNLAQMVVIVLFKPVSSTNT